MTIESRTAPGSRRAFLQLLATSPLLRGLTATGLVAEPWVAALLDPALAQTPALIRSVDEAFNVFDFEPVLRANVNPGHYAYMAQGVDDGSILRVNREGFDKYQLLPRRLVDTRNVDLSIELFGETYAHPIFIAPAGTHTMFHAEGELAVARAARAKRGLMILSTVTNYTVEDVAAVKDVVQV